MMPMKKNIEFYNASLSHGNWGRHHRRELTKREGEGEGEIQPTEPLGWTYYDHINGTRFPLTFQTVHSSALP